MVISNSLSENLTGLEAITDAGASSAGLFSVGYSLNFMKEH